MAAVIESPMSKVQGPKSKRLTSRSNGQRSLRATLYFGRWTLDTGRWTLDLSELET